MNPTDPINPTTSAVNAADQTRKYFIIGIVVILLIALGVFGFIYSAKQHTIEKVEADYNSGNLDGAIETAENLLSKNKNDVSALLALAATYAQMGSVTFKEEGNAMKAIEYADRAIASSPSKDQESEAYRIKGYAYEIQEMYAEAHTNYEKAISLNPQNSQAVSNNGHAYDLEGDMIKAEALYLKALEILSSNDHALLNLGRLYIRQEKWSEAKITLDTIFSSSPNNRIKGEAYQLLSYIAYHEADLDLALAHINTALAFDATMSVAWVTKAKIEYATALNMETEAQLQALLAQIRSDIDKALAINPNQASAYVLLSEVEIITGDKAKQLEYKKTALQAIPLDITLGKAEKEALKSYLESEIKVTKSSATEIK